MNKKTNTVRAECVRIGDIVIEHSGERVVRSARVISETVVVTYDGWPNADLRARGDGVTIVDRSLV